ncbi:MAG TPA: hypothetical protein VLA97_07380 [Nocardioidaceae bacterium]|nr:hypothetical protein [Nocardioidaceae bacterium]
MKRHLAALTAPLLTLALLAGCSGEDNAADETATSSSPSPSAATSPEASGSANAPGAGSRYCELLETDFASVFSQIQKPEDVTKALDMIREIVDEAPAEVQDEWQLMSGALDDMESALKKSAELQQQAQAGEISKKKLQQEFAKLTQQMQALNTPENQKAGEAVTTHASDYCGVDLG